MNKTGEMNLNVVEHQTISQIHFEFYQFEITSYSTLGLESEWRK